MKSKQIAIGIALGLLLTTLCGCQVFQVRDAEGKVIRGATVNIQTTNGESNFPMWTGVFGEALTFVSTEPKGTSEWVEVSKKGYRTNKVSRTNESKMSIVLQKLPDEIQDLDLKNMRLND